MLLANGKVKVRPIISGYEGPKLTDIYKESLRKVGKVLVGRCPFHDDSGNPNFRIYPETNSWYCFRCGEGGSVWRYLWKMKNT